MKNSARASVAQFLAEDIGKGDITSRLLPKGRMSAHIIAKESGVLAGTEFAAIAFRLSKCTVRHTIKDGKAVKAGQKIMQVRGPAYGVLSAERTALNLLSRMSGIATQTHRLVGMISKSKARLYATRKTAPGLAFFDKEAVSIGGGQRHRTSLDQMVLIKDNHIAFSRTSRIKLEALVRKAVSKHGKVEVEVETIADALIAAKAGASIIMLDNFTPSNVRGAIKALEKQGLRRKVKLEASGRISERNIRAYAATGVDMISVGSITSRVNGIDMSLESN